MPSLILLKSGSTEIFFTWVSYSSWTDWSGSLSVNLLFECYIKAERIVFGFVTQRSQKKNDVYMIVRPVSLDEPVMISFFN